MALLLSKSLLADLGVTLDEAQYALLEEHFESTLQERVINEIIAELTPDQAAELAALYRESGDEGRLMSWITQNVPDFGDIVADETDILLGELAENREQL